VKTTHSGFIFKYGQLKKITSSSRGNAGYTLSIINFKIQVRGLQIHALGLNFDFQNATSIIRQSPKPADLFLIPENNLQYSFIWVGIKTRTWPKNQQPGSKTQQC
jgi:hypothetical protein